MQAHAVVEFGEFPVPNGEGPFSLPGAKNAFPNPQRACEAVEKIKRVLAILVGHKVAVIGTAHAAFELGWFHPSTPTTPKFLPERLVGQE